MYILFYAAMLIYGVHMDAWNFIDNLYFILYFMVFYEWALLNLNLVQIGIQIF